ncbi:MAG TPA: alkaline phosphatase family protein, partial [Myxococcota bacterium]|nr:alkaline phosphatase family protein [Myxococcota bacterium]
MVRLATAVNRGRLPFLLVIMAACASKDTTPAAPEAVPPYLTVFLVDGLVQDVFARELAAGRLPNIDTMVREGTVIENGISSFPSMTAYGFYPFITGEDAAASGVLGLRWLDRGRGTGIFRNYVGRTYKLMNEDLKAEPRTIFEVAGSLTQTFQSYMNR